MTNSRRQSVKHNPYEQILDDAMNKIKEEVSSEMFESIEQLESFQTNEITGIPFPYGYQEKSPVWGCNHDS